MNVLSRGSGKFVLLVKTTHVFARGVVILNWYSINIYIYKYERVVQRGSQVCFPSQEKQCMYLPEGVASLTCYGANATALFTHGTISFAR